MEGQNGLGSWPSIKYIYKIRIRIRIGSHPHRIRIIYPTTLHPSPDVRGRVRSEELGRVEGIMIVIVTSVFVLCTAVHLQSVRDGGTAIW